MLSKGKRQILGGYVLSEPALKDIRVDEAVRGVHPELMNGFELEERRLINDGILSLEYLHSQRVLASTDHSHVETVIQHLCVGI